MKSIIFSALFLFTFLPQLGRSAIGGEAKEKQFQGPKLLLVIVVDQMRADYLTRFRSRFLPPHGKDGKLGGFSFLMENGAYFPFAEYDVLQNMTGPGHSMILSGSYPYQTGIPINTWLETRDGKQQETYCVQDAASAIVGISDPAAVGMSPRNFIGSTLGDEMKFAGLQSKVVAVSLKDRAAILLGGKRADLALWFDTKSFQWVSSKYYVNELPAWLTDINKKILNEKGSTFQWKSQSKSTGLTLGSEGIFERSATIGTKESLSFPYGPEITNTVAKKSIDSFALGSGKVTDILAVSYSSHDFLGHVYGANTRELEEMTIAEDQKISDLINYVDKKIPGGIKNVSIVLTADHGVSPSASWLNSMKVAAGRLDPVKMVEALESRLGQKFGKERKWVRFHNDFNFYFDEDSIKQKGISRILLENEAKEELRKWKGVKFVFSKTDYENKAVPPVQFERQINKTFYSKRSGDIIIIPEPFYYMVEDEYPVEHMTGYSYDRTVPLIFYGTTFKKGIYASQANIVDIAPTLAFVLGVIPPSLSEGRALHEIIRTFPLQFGP